MSRFYLAGFAIGAAISWFSGDWVFAFAAFCVVLGFGVAFGNMTR